MWIIIESGNVFEGTIEQFVENFGGSADDNNVRSFCERDGALGSIPARSIRGIDAWAHRTSISPTG